MAVYYWLQAVQIVGTATRPEDEGTLLGRFIDVVTTVDPWVGHPYRFAAVWLTGSEEDVRQANRLLERSFEYHPDEWRNRFYLGFNHFYYLEEEEPAAHWLEEAARIEGSPRYLGGLAARLRAGQSGIEVAARMIHRLMAEAEDPYAKAEYEKMLDEIETERRARFLDAAREAISNVGRVEGWHPQVKRSPVLTPEPTGMGAQRRCHFYDGTSVVETVTDDMGVLLDDVIERAERASDRIHQFQRRRREREARAGHRPRASDGPEEFEDIEAWLADPGIIRHRGKLEMLRRNARSFLALDDPAAFLWRYVSPAPLQTMNTIKYATRTGRR